MAKTIAIELEVNGVKESVKTIGELETAIEGLTEELKKTEIGSEAFNKLTTELNNAKSELKTFEKQFEGLEPEQKAQAYLAFGEGVVSGILLAQEALRSFGVENENVNSAVEASTKAINIALQARIVIESVLQARVLATTLAQKALNTQMVIGNRVLKAIFTTMAANPIGAVLAAIGLLVTAFIALSESSEESEKAFGSNEQAQRDLELQTLKTTRALEELKTETDETIKSFENFNLQQTTDELASLQTQLDELSSTQNEVRDFGKSFGELGNDILNGVVNIKDLNLTLAEEKLLLEAAQDGLEGYIGVFKNEVSDKNIEGIKNLIELLSNSISEAEGETEALTKQIEVLQNRLKQLRKEASAKELDRFSKTIENAADEVDRLNRNLLDFGEAPTPKIIEDLQELLALQVQLQDISEENRKTLGDVFNEYTTNLNKVNKTFDDFGDRYEATRVQLTNVFKTGDVEAFGQTLEQVRKEYLDSDDFTNEQKRSIASLLSGYKVAFESLTSLGVEGAEDFITLVSPLLDGLGQKLQLEGDIKFENLEPIIERFNGLGAAAVVSADGVEEVRQNTQDFIREFVLDSKTLEKGSTEFYEARQKLIDDFTEQFLTQARFRRLATEDEAKARELASKEAEEQVDKIVDTITKTAQAEDAIRGVYNTFEDLQTQVNATNKDTDILFGLILTNFDKFKEEFDFEEVLDPTADFEKNFQAIEQFFTDIGAAGILQLYKDEEEKKEIVKFFLEQRQKLVEENAEKEKKTQEELLDDTLSNYQEVVNGLNQLTLSLGEKSQLEIERLEQQREESLSNIVGDTEEAEKLRAEITEDTNRQIVEVERKARLRELQFTKIQGVADLAQALINAQKLPPPFNVIQSGIVGTAGAIQLAVIESQIQDLQSAQGFKTGGFVSGPGTSTSDSIPALLSDGEFVVNAKSTKRFLPLLEKINNQEEQFRKFNNGGFVLDGSSFMGSTLQNNFDDSRIIEELRRVRQEPLRAYVFEKDITDAQQIEKRLQELSKL